MACECDQSLFLYTQSVCVYNLHECLGIGTVAVSCTIIIVVQSHYSGLDGTQPCPYNMEKPKNAWSMFLKCIQIAIPVHAKNSQGQTNPFLKEIFLHSKMLVHVLSELL